MGQVCLLVDRVSGFVIAGEKHWEGLQHHQITNQSFRPGAHDTELWFLDLASGGGDAGLPRHLAESWRLE